MRHYIAVQDESGKWFYANEGISRVTGLAGWSPSGACSRTMACPVCKANNVGYGTVEQKACKVCDGTYSVQNPAPCQGHETAAEAYEHQRHRRLSCDVDFYDDDPEPRTQYRCGVEGCKAMTSGGVRIGAWFRKHICADHRNVDSVAPLYRVGESWES